MAVKKVNTTKSINTPTFNETEYTHTNHEMKKIFEEMEHVEVSIPKQFKNVVGSTVPVSVNFVTYVIPADGKKYKIPKSHAEVLMNSLQTLQPQDVAVEDLQEETGNENLYRA